MNDWIKRNPPKVVMSIAGQGFEGTDIKKMPKTVIRMGRRCIGLSTTTL